ncbi:GNAT family N-acetyltransferase [Isoptericola sp. NPDC056605]|uniref:GNAT family N-acetyltransferase n=1 Tax=Isoptericola sp. NPDC056605 TaxID=3345876 RepID=UPI0036ABB99E
MSESTTPKDPHLQVRIGCQRDVPAIEELARRRLPTMSHLHDRSSWDRTDRFGPGSHPRDRYSPVVHDARTDGTENLVAFAWVDAALADDYGVEEPWWCINAIAVAEPYAGHGIGGGLVEMIEGQAREAGVVSLYGQAYQSAAQFWRSNGFSVGALGGLLTSESKVSVAGRGRQQVVLNAEANQHFFVKQIDGSPGVRLRTAQRDTQS